MKTPLELYESAYDLHYTKNDPGKACVIYKEIIRNFPKSIESGYSVIQLEKIIAEDVLENLETKPQSGKISILFFILSMIIAASVAVFLYLETRQLKAEITSIENCTQAFSKAVSVGDTKSALRILTRERNLHPSSLTVSSLIADIYAMEGKYQQALGELITFRRNNLSNKTVVSYINTMNKQIQEQKMQKKAEADTASGEE